MGKKMLRPVLRRWWDQEASEYHPAEHRDRHCCGDEEPSDSAGQQGLHRWQHQLKQLWRNVSTHSAARCFIVHITAYVFFQFPLNCSFVFPTTRLGPESQFSDFLDGLGPAQIVGRQTLATPPMGMVTVINFLSLMHCIFIHCWCFIALLGETITREHICRCSIQGSKYSKKCWIAKDWGAKSQMRI